MPAARLPQSEKERLKALLDYDILDTGFEQVYDELTELASSICETPISLVSLVDENRQWFKSIVGIEARETPRDWAFCAHAILDQEEVLHVPDATKDPRFSDNPLVKEAPNIRLYAGVPLVNPAGHALGTLCVIDDKPRGLNDDQLKALRTLARQVVDQLELRRSLRLLKEHSDELKEANQRKDRLFSIVAHDLRNPLGGIVTLTDSLRRDFKSLDPEAGTELAEEIYQSGRQALDLFNNLHDWARNETGLNQPAMKSMDLREVGQKAHDLLGSFATKKKIVILLEDDGELMVKVDPNMMSSLVQNLLTNAIKFSNPGQEIRLCLSRNKSEAVLQVIDQGVGIADDQIDSLFEIAGVSSTKGTDGEVGSGLGLLLCRQFAEAMGGQLEASSKLGKGSTFTLTLPLIEE